MNFEVSVSFALLKNKSGGISSTRNQVKNLKLTLQWELVNTNNE